MGEGADRGGGRGVVAERKRRACTGRVQLEAGGKRVCAECTSNMYFMPVTLDASKLSGWLNADAYCRVERRACDAGGRGAAREA